jgi:ATP-dependent helicase/nuclease subunit A
MAYQPNEQQQMAIDEFASDLLVSAGAGTGKTSVLTKKYLKLLEKCEFKVSEIVAITFTKKAALEMSDRIQKEIREKYEQAVDPQEKAFWQTQLTEIEKARITTFHSLCLGLIREYPIEAGIPPATEVLDDGEESMLLHATIMATLTAALQADAVDTEFLGRALPGFTGWCGKAG